MEDETKGRAWLINLREVRWKKIKKRNPGFLCVCAHRNANVCVGIPGLSGVYLSNRRRQPRKFRYPGCGSNARKGVGNARKIKKLRYFSVPETCAGTIRNFREISCPTSGMFCRGRTDGWLGVIGTNDQAAPNTRLFKTTL